jgi:hypothetical protein
VNTICVGDVLGKNVSGNAERGGEMLLVQIWLCMWFEIFLATRNWQSAWI